MSDIVERLRAAASMMRKYKAASFEAHELDDAANLIEEQAAVIARWERAVVEAPDALSTAREEGRLEGLEEADKAIASDNNDMKAAIEEAGGKASLADEAFMEGREDALSVIRALKEKQQ